MFIRWLAVPTALLIALCVTLPSGACADEGAVDRLRYFRQLTLDLLGRAPSLEELDAVAQLDSADEIDIEALIDDPGFSTLIRRHHRDLLWPANQNLDLFNALAILFPAQFYGEGGDGERLFLLFTGQNIRGGIVPCKDEPAEWDDDGELVFEDWPDGTRREGYVMVEPYWAPGTEVKVCALEARIEPVAQGLECDTFNGLSTGACGCGPNLMYCGSFQVVQDLVSSLQEQLLRSVETPIRAGRPYHEMLTEQREWVNGPLVHYYRYQTAMGVDPLIQTAPVFEANLPEMDYTDRTWRQVERGPAEHSGILTSMSYLLRFQTGRARANRFYNAFLCEPFIAPAGGLPSPNAACSQAPNIRERCGCQSCHIKLEPAAAHWGRFAEAGTMYVDPAEYPTYLARCAACAERGGRGCDFVCERFYVSEIGHPDEAPFAGVLKTYEWRDAAEIANLEAGPEALVRKSIESGGVARCAARKLFTRLYQREPTRQERIGIIREFADQFVDSGYDWRALVAAMVTHPAYRRTGR